MKLISIILSLMFLNMAFIPCSDSLGHEEHPTFVDEHDHPQDHEDDCTPFCVCSCCSSDLLEARNEIDDIDMLSFVSLGSPSFVAHVVSFSYNPMFWHPPKLTKFSGSGEIHSCELNFILKF